MKAGLVTFYHIHHYGALLQAAATERAVERFGWDCEIIDYFVNQDNALFKRPTGLGSAAHDAHTALHYQALSERYRRFEKFSRDHLRISDRRYGRTSAATFSASNSMPWSERASSAATTSGS